MDPSRKTTASTRPLSISPPPKRRRTHSITRDEIQAPVSLDTQVLANDLHFSSKKTAEGIEWQIVPSPVQLNFIDQLPAESNADTISLGSILGDVMIRECWLFNYLFDVDYIMSQFDPDVKDLVSVKLIHGFWKREDTRRHYIDEATIRYSKVSSIPAYLPDRFGTHHTKMIILFRHDDLAQVIILTANFIARDWIMSQAIWKSPILPLEAGNRNWPSSPRLGDGRRFKQDLMAYLKSYGNKLQSLISQLSKYDFSSVRAAFIASTPGRQHSRSMDSKTESSWGWPALQKVLSNVPGKPQTRGNDEPHIAIQISSVASIGEKWLFETLLPVLSCIKNVEDGPKASSTALPPSAPKFSIIFPTPAEIRRSVDGYGSGSSIHMKIQSSAQAKQLSAIRPMLCHWAGDQTVPRAHGVSEAGDISILPRRAHRGRAAPHIKTYIRFSDQSMTRIDWAMVTSANLSRQAWGTPASATGEVKLESYEVGVIVWPALWDDVEKDETAAECGDGLRTTVMVPTFGSDVPQSEEEKVGDMEVKIQEMQDTQGLKRVVGWRMPYDLPLVPYQAGEMPWCTSSLHTEPDWKGRIWTQGI